MWVVEWWVSRLSSGLVHSKKEGLACRKAEVRERWVREEEEVGERRGGGEGRVGGRVIERVMEGSNESSAWLSRLVEEADREGLVEAMEGLVRERERRLDRVEIEGDFFTALAPSAWRRAHSST